MNQENQLPSMEDDVFVKAYPETLPFWQAAEEGRFLAKKCQSCGKFHWYPRIICPLCGSDETEWEEISGKGKIYSYSIVEKADPPFCLVWIELEEGPIMIANLVDTEFKEVNIGDLVKVQFKRSVHGRRYPVFSPVSSDEVKDEK